MAKVTINEAPAAVVTAMGKNEPFTTKDAVGRTFTLKKPGILQQMRMLEFVGPEAAENRPYMTIATSLGYIIEIDGEVEPTMTSKRMLEALIQRLDDHGVNAVIEAVTARMGELSAEAEKASLKK